MEILNLIYQVVILIGMFSIGTLVYGVWKSTDTNTVDSDVEIKVEETKKNKYTDYVIYKNLRK